MAIQAREFAQTAYDVAVSSTGLNDNRDPVIRYTDMDCQAFVENVLSRLGTKKNWSGSNAIWRDLAWRGTPEEAKKLFGSVPVGALLFIWTEDTSGCKAKYQRDGQGNAEHVGVYTALGKGAAHSSSSRRGVCQSKFVGRMIPNGGWNRVGLLKIIDYGDRINRILMEAATASDPALEVGAMDNTAVVKSDNGAGVRLRSAKSVKSNTVIMNVPEGSQVIVVEDDGTWSLVQYPEGGRVETGYVMSKYLVSENTSAVIVSGDQIQIMLDRSVAVDLLSALRNGLGVE